MTLITASLKDKLLAYILSTELTTFQISFDKYDENLGMSAETAVMILRYFLEIGLLSKATFFSNPRGAIITVTVKAHDLWAHVGFTAQEEILKQTLKS